MNNNDFMANVNELAIEGLRGIVRKGALFTFMLFCIGGLIFHVEREKKACISTSDAQAVRIRSLESEMIKCVVSRAEQDVEIKNLQGQINTLSVVISRKK